MANQTIAAVVSSIDVVGVFDSGSLNQVFAAARPMKAQVREYSKVMEHPLETGAMISDHRVVQQNEIEISLMIPQEDYASAYYEIKNLFTQATLLAVQTRTGLYQNMFILAMPHEETPDVYNMVPMSLRLKEVFFAPSPTTYDPVDVPNQNTQQNGQQLPTEKVYSPELTGDASRSFTSGGVTVTPQQAETISSGALTVTPL